MTGNNIGTFPQSSPGLSLLNKRFYFKVVLLKNCWLDRCYQVFSLMANRMYGQLISPVKYQNYTNGQRYVGNSITHVVCMTILDIPWVNDSVDSILHVVVNMRNHG